MIVIDKFSYIFIHKYILDIWSSLTPHSIYWYEWEYLSNHESRAQAHLKRGDKFSSVLSNYVNFILWKLIHLWNNFVLFFVHCNVRVVENYFDKIIFLFSRCVYSVVKRGNVVSIHSIPHPPTMLWDNACLWRNAVPYFVLLPSKETNIINTSERNWTYKQLRLCHCAKYN